jgi:hypothetical protein
MTIKLFFFLVVLQFASFNLQNIKAQVRMMSGTVLDKSGPLENSTIENISKKTGVVADDKGRFTIKVEPTDTILVKSLGFRSKTLVGFEGENVKVILDPEIYDLSPVLIVPKYPIYLKKGFVDKKPNGGFSPSSGSMVAYRINRDENIKETSFLFDVSFH